MEDYKPYPEKFSPQAAAAILITAFFSSAISVGLTIGFMTRDIIMSVIGTLIFTIPAAIVSGAFAGLITEHMIDIPKWWMCFPAGVVISVLATFGGSLMP